MAGSPFTAHAAEFAAVLGAAPRLVKVADVDAHEGPVYVAAEDALYFTSLPKPSGLPLPGSPQVSIKRIALDGDRFPVSDTSVRVVQASPGAANGMVAGPAGSL